MTANFPTRCFVTLVVSSLLVYGLMSYWGIRSPDGEVVFRTAQSLATEGTFAVPVQLPRGMVGFGLPRGRDDKYYSIFGPGQALASVPLVKIGILLNKTHWYELVPKLVPVSCYVDNDGVRASPRWRTRRTWNLTPCERSFAFSMFLSARCASPCSSC